MLNCLYRNKIQWLGLLTLSILCFVAAPCLGQGKGNSGGKNKASLTVTVAPESFSESDPGATGTVTRENSDTGVALTVKLESSNTEEATVPGSVEIPAGAASVDFAVTAIDDMVEDGEQSVTILATATGHSEASFSVTVTDDETVSVGYRVSFIPIPEDASGSMLYDVNNLGQAVGSFSIPDPDRDIGSRYVSFLYDAVSGTYISSDQMIALDPQWRDVTFVGMNNLGAIVGRIDNLTREISAGIIVYPDDAGWSYEILPSPGFSKRSWARKINDDGDIVGTYYVETAWQEDESALYGAFAINTGLYRDADILPLTDFQIPVRVYPILSNARVGVVENLDGPFGFDFTKAYSLYDSDPDNDQEPVSPVPLPSENYYLAQNSLSDDGQLAIYERVLASKKRGGTYAITPAVVQDGVVLWKADFESNIFGVNSAAGENLIGDVLGGRDGISWMQHADRGYLNIEDMLVFDNLDDVNLWYSVSPSIRHISDRETLTSFGYLGGNQFPGAFERGVPFVLVPVILP
jgi:hypothetical protein